MSESSARQLLVVDPNRRIAMTDETLDAFIYKFFGVEPPSSLRKIIAAGSGFGSLSLVGLLGRLGAYDSMRIHDSLGPLRDLLRGLIADRLLLVLLRLLCGCPGLGGIGLSRCDLRR